MLEIDPGWTSSNHDRSIRKLTLSTFNYMTWYWVHKLVSPPGRDWLSNLTQGHYPPLTQSIFGKKTHTIITLTKPNCGCTWKDFTIHKYRCYISCDTKMMKLDWVSPSVLNTLQTGLCDRWCDSPLSTLLSNGILLLHVALFLNHTSPGRRENNRRGQNSGDTLEWHVLVPDPKLTLYRSLSSDSPHLPHVLLDEWIQGRD